MTIEMLGYVIVQTAKMEEWDRFLLDVVGVMVAGEGVGGDGARHYRIDQRPFRFRIVPGAAERLLAAYRLDTHARLTDLQQRVASAGRPVIVGTVEGAAERGVDAYFTTNDPAGNGLEFYCGDSADSTVFVSASNVSGFVTGAMGMGHAVFAAPNFLDSYRFYRDVVGFHDSDLPTFHLMGPDGPPTHFAFMHADNARHHSLAIGEMPSPPSGCVHIMLEMKSLLDVGRCHDRMRQAAIPESATLGKHSNDKMTSFYMQTPSGFDLEIGYDGLMIDPTNWIPTAHATISDWGHVWAWQKAMEQANDGVR